MCESGFAVRNCQDARENTSKVYFIDLIFKKYRSNFLKRSLLAGVGAGAVSKVKLDFSDKLFRY